MTPRAFLIRGLVAGFLASFLAFAVAYTVGEPQVDAAIAVEEANAAAAPADEPASDGHSHSHAEEDGGTEVSRQNQSTWGLLTGLVAVGTALGGVVGLAAAFAMGRLGRLTPGQSTALVTAVGFVAFWLVPFFKYPANPPAVGSGDTIGDRTLWYFVVLAISLVSAVGAVALSRRLLPRFGAYRTVLASVGGYAVVVTVTALAMPTSNELGDFPADVLWYFRLSTLFTNGVLWLGIGVILVGLIGSLHQRESLAHARREMAANL